MSTARSSVSRVYAPNEYSVWLSPEDRARYEGVEHEVIDELCAYLLEHARREELILASHPLIVFHTDERLALGEFGIQARLVRAGGPSEEPHRPEQLEEHGQTMIYSTSARVGGPVEEVRSRRPVSRARCWRSAAGVCGCRPKGARSAAAATATSCSTTSGSPAVTPRSVPAPTAGRSQDLGSTNGVLVNGQEALEAQPLHSGDRVELGSTEIVFEVG